MRRLFLSISICLFAVFSSEAQVADSLRRAAVEFERIYFSEEDPAVAEHALVCKAECLMRAGLTDEALSTLRRIEMFRLDEDDRSHAQDLIASLSPDAPDMPRKPARRYSAVSAFIPPIGHFRAGEPGRGILTALADAGAVTFGIWQISSGHWITGWLCGAVILDICYFDEAVRLAPILTGE